MQVFEEFKTPPLPTEFTYYGDTKELIVEYSGEVEARVFFDVPKEVFQSTLHKDNKRRNADWLRMENNYQSITFKEWHDGTE